MPGSTTTTAYNIAALNAQQQALQSGLLQENGSGDGGDSGVDDGMSGQLLATGNASNPYAATSGQGNYVVSVPGAGAGWTQDISAGKNGTTQITAPTYTPDDSWGKFLTVAGIGGAFAGAALGAAGEFADAGAAADAGGGAVSAAPTASSGALSADDSLAQIGNWSGDTVYGTSAPGGLADASGAGIPGSASSSLLQQGQNLYQQLSPYKTALQGAQQVAGLDNGQASTVGSPQGVSGAGGSNSTLGGLGGLLGLAGGIYGATQANGNAQAGINIADPNQQNQAGYLSQLQNLVNNPSSVNNNAEFQAANNSALAGVSANMAAGGFNGSGNIASALYQTGLADQQNFYQQDVTNLEKLGGIDQAQQGTAAQIQQGIGSNISSLLNGAGNGLSALLGNGSIGSALSSLGSGASSAYNSIFGSSGGSDWGSTASGGEGVTSNFGVSEAASGSGISDDALSASTDAGNDFSDAFSFF